MKIADMLSLEGERQDPSTWNKIYLHKEGTFIHAYDWSAWLIKTFVCTEEFQQLRGDAKILSANKYKAKGSFYVMIGFPVESLSKYIPSYDVLTMGEPSENFCISVDISSLGNDFETLNSLFEAWKEQCPEKEKKVRTKDEQQQQAQALGRSGIFSIVSQIIGYPAENTTPIQDKEFISQLKQQVAALL